MRAGRQETGRSFVFKIVCLKLDRNKLIDTENKLMVAPGEAGGGLFQKGKGIKKYKLPVMQ